MAALIFTACSQDENLQYSTGSHTILASMESNGSESRTAFDRETGDLYWISGDDIAVLSTAGNFTHYTLTDGAGTANATFTAATKLGENTTYALHPFSAHKYVNSVLTYNLPATYVYDETEKGNEYGAAPMIAVTDEPDASNFYFEHLGGAFCFTIKNIPADATYFKFEADEQITGDFAVTTDGEGKHIISLPTTHDATVTANSVTINFPAEGVLSNKRFFVPLPVGTFNGFKISIGTSEGEAWSKTSDATNTIERKTLLAMPVITLDATVDGSVATGVATQEELQSVLEEGGSAILIDDIELTETLSISEDVTIDLNGYNMDVNENGFVVAEGKKLTIIDSKAGSTMSVRAASVGTSITGTGDIITAKANSDITIGEGVNLITTGANCCCIFVPRYSENVTINSAGNLLATTAGAGTIYVNGYIENCTINITGGSVKHDQDVAIYIAGNANLNINGGEIVGTTAVEIRAGQLNVTDGNFEATADEFTATPNGNGSTSTGAAIAVTQHSTNKALNAMISGGTFTGVKALYEEDTCDDNVSGISMSVTGGTFNGEIFSENCKKFIQAGTFSNPSACNYLGEGANVTVELAENYEGAGFATASGQTVVLDLNNKTYTATDPLVGSTGTKSQAFQFLKGSNVTIKNGTLTSSQARMFVQNYTDLTLENVTLSPSIPAQTTSSYYYVLSNNSGNVKLEGNTSIIAPTKNGISSFAFDVCKYATYEAPVVTVNTTGTIEGLVEVSGGTLNVTNGTFKNENGNCVKVVNGTANFNGGNFTAQEVAVFNMAGTVNIAGGTFTSNDNAVISGNGSDDAKYKNGIIEITGGVFNAKIQSSGYVACGIYHPQAGTLKVSGGTFNIENGCGILMRGGSLDMNGNASFNFTGNTSGEVTGKVGDSRVVVPCGKKVVKDAYSAYYDAQNITITGVDDIYTVE